MRRLLKPLWIFLALLFLFEAWLWERLAPVVAFLVRLVPLKALKARVAAAVERLPPYPSLLVFLIPVVIILPFKLVGVALIAKGHAVLGLCTFIAAKLVGFGATAFLYETCKSKLMQIPAFLRVYDWCQRAKAWAHRHVDPVKAALKAWKEAHVDPLKARLRAWFAGLQPEGRGHLVRFIVRLRDHVQRVRLARAQARTPQQP